MEGHVSPDEGDTVPEGRGGGGRGGREGKEGRGGEEGGGGVEGDRSGKMIE